MEVDHVIKVTLTNEILKRISEIDEKRFSLSTIEMTPVIKNRLRKNSKKKSSYASNKIEGNPLTEKQANEAIDSDPHKHFLKPEQEVRNYFLALNFLEEKLKKKEAFSKEMILEVQAMVEKGASKEKIGLRGPMPPGMLFAVYDSETGAAEYIPPEYIDIPDLLDELVEYVNTTDDHPLIIAAVVHYQSVIFCGQFNTCLSVSLPAPNFRFCPSNLSYPFPALWAILRYSRVRNVFNAAYCTIFRL